MIFDNRKELKFGISVVIPTFNKGSLLRRTLDSLLNQSISLNLYEIIIVDDGSSDNTYEIVKPYSALYSNVRYFLTADDGFRVSRARNIGINASTRETILLFDSGMIAGTSLLEKHLEIHRLNVKSAVIGLSYGVSEVGLSSCIQIKNILSQNSVDDSLRVMSEIPEVQDCRFIYFRSLGFDLSRLTSPWAVFWTGHVSFKKEAAIDINGFDENFRSWGGEDVDFGYRLYQKNFNFLMLNSIHSIHYPHDKDPDDKMKSGIKNLNYMNDKYMNPWMKLLETKGWAEVCDLSMIKDEVEL